MGSPFWLALLVFFSGFLGAFATNGDSFCDNTGICVTATVNGSNILYALKAPMPASKLGWIAVGFGDQMPNSPMIITWPNSNGHITISQREATAHVMPQVQSDPLRIASLVPDQVSLSGDTTTIVVSVPNDSKTKVNQIYALSTTRPSSDDPAATLVQHLTSGTFTLDLAKTLPSSNGTTGSSGTNHPAVFTSPPFTMMEKKIIAHAVLCSLGFLIFLPIGALLARFRVVNPYWFKLHFMVQLGLAGPVIIAGWALAVNVVGENGGPHFSDSHQKAGLALFILYIIQVLVGLFIHYVKPSAPRARPPQNYFHVVIGLSIVALAFYNAHKGYSYEWPAFTGRTTPKGVNIVWIIWVVIMPLTYFAGLSMVKRQYANEKQAREAHYAEPKAAPA
ncbi:hypothetical protein BOTBODRAFT_32087 [Botryobasidium botryosum FD-172 SS1]|uniref:Cytochrome b561 domain-containing protein n=1 Tax=Botryobasidium botryosum (strain FD-172 SS1) TaxID=930990 RepID=A0A067MH35_BOTB1|nr:hypothetical protein BOTBODRAFT_32087 [Botryobasidium botryosum FD-172 SS1]